MATTDTSPIRERSFEEGRELFDRQARLRLGMSGEEFLRAWDAGEFGDRDDSDLMGVAMMLPFVR
jgi:hypothetical protein